MLMNLFLEKRVKRNNMVKNVRQNRTRFKLKKVTNRKRLTVFRSNNHIYAQIINDDKGITLASASSIEKIFRGNNHSKKELAEKIGTEMGYTVDYHEFNENIKQISNNDIDKTIEIANQYDIVVVVVGDNSMRYKWKQKTAGENTARTELNLAGKQLDLVMKLKDLSL